jgi:hypothetical protein
MIRVRNALSRLIRVGRNGAGTDKFYLILFGSLDKQALAKGGCRDSITKIL